MTPKEIAELIFSARNADTLTSTFHAPSVVSLAQAYLDLLAENERLRAALEWYANKDNWAGVVKISGGGMGIDATHIDKGYMARKALEREVLDEST